MQKRFILGTPTPFSFYSNRFIIIQCSFLKQKNKGICLNKELRFKTLLCRHEEY